MKLRSQRKQFVRRIRRFQRDKHRRQLREIVRISIAVVLLTLFVVAALRRDPGRYVAQLMIGAFLTPVIRFYFPRSTRSDFRS